MLEFTVFVLGIIVFVLSMVIVIMLKRNNGDIMIIKDPDGSKVFSLELNTDPEELENMNTVKFRIVKSEIAD